MFNIININRLIKVKIMFKIKNDMKSKVKNVVISYKAPTLEVVDIKLEQNILEAGSGNGSGDTPFTGGEGW